MYIYIFKGNAVPKYRTDIATLQVICLFDVYISLRTAGHLTKILYTILFIRYVPQFPPMIFSSKNIYH